MPGGRPSQGKQQRHPELEELATWFHEALREAGFESVHEFLGNGLFEKNAVYGVFGATKLLTLESTQSLATALKRGPAEVAPVWLRAREARDRTVLATAKDNSNRVESWLDLPLPSLALQNLLEAQSASSERLPYALLGVGEPALSEVYVRQQVQARLSEERFDRNSGSAGDSSDVVQSTRSGSQSALPIWDALERHRHLLVTGEPGAGKSTLGNHLVHSLSRVWLREANSADIPLSMPLVPVRIAARFLDSEGSWSDVMVQAVVRSLGRSLLQQPDAGLFAGRVQGVQWLIVVDGLDEIPDPRVRSDVIRSVAQHARTGGDYRFVITTRTLPQAELAALRNKDLGNYVIQPFSTVELQEFARKWFAAQEMGPSDADAAADRFIRETSGGRLRELVHNPLMATIAAVAAVKEPDRSLPNSRVNLYERFCGYLLDAQARQREQILQLRRRHKDDPDRLGCLLWLHQQRSALLSTVACGLLDAESSVWSSAITWVAENAPKDVILVDGWKDHLWEELVGTGLLVVQEDELRFLHQSFAEFLAAKTHAETIGGDFEDLNSWIEKSFKESQRSFALFTLTLWAARPEHDLSRIIERLLERRDPRRLFVAGELLAEGVVIPDEASARVAHKLVMFARNVDDPDGSQTALRILGNFFDHPDAVHGLDELARSETRLISRRAEAMVAFEHVRGGARARELLMALLPSAYGNTLEKMLPSAVRLGPVAVEAMAHRIQSMLDEQDCDSGDRVDAVELLCDLNQVDNVERIARRVLSDKYADGAELGRAARAWHRAQGDRAVSHIAALARDRPRYDLAGRMSLSRFLYQVGDHDASAELAEEVVNSEFDDGDATNQAVDILVSIRGRAAVPIALKAADRWSQPQRVQNSWTVARILRRLIEVEESETIRSRLEILAQQCVAPTAIGVWDIFDALIAVQGTAGIDSVMILAQQGKILSYYDQANFAEALYGVGASAQAVNVIDLVLTSRLAGKYQFGRAASILIKASGAAHAATRLAELIESDPEPPAQWYAGMLGIFDLESSLPFEEIAIRCARRLIEITVISEDLKDALNFLIWFDPSWDLDNVVEIAVNDSRLQVDHRRSIALNLAAADELDYALRVWRDLLKWQEYSWSHDIDLIRDLLNSGLGSWANEQLQVYLNDPNTPSSRRARIRLMMAEIDLNSSERFSGQHGPLLSDQVVESGF